MRHHRHTSPILLVAAAVLAAAITEPAAARIKLITLPVREKVEIQLDNDNVTLVEEERIVPLVQGTNQIDFSWANTRIDPNTIVFRVLEAVGDNQFDVNVLSVSYPPGENALVWQVSSAASGAARVRISYILGALDKSFNYRAIAANNEKTLILSQYMRVRNLANEEFGSSDISVGYGRDFAKPIGINETKEMLVRKYLEVPIKKTYTCDPAMFDYLDRPKDKLRVPMHYVLKNDDANQLGKAPLPYGKVRIFQDDGRGTTAFIGEDWGDYTPIDDEMELYLGVAQDIVVKRTIDKREQKRVAGNLYDYDVVIKYEIENFKDSAVSLDVSEHLRHIRNEIRGDTGRDVQWELGGQTTLGDPDKEKTTVDRALFHVDLPAAEKGKAEKIIHKLHVRIRNEW